MGQMPGQSRYSEQRRISFHFYCFAVRHKLQDSQPAVTSITFGTTPNVLHIKHHLMHILTRSVLIYPVTDIIFIFAVSITRMPTDQE